MKTDRSRDIDTLLEYLKRNRGFDFTGYKRASLTRRIHKRMQAIGVKTSRPSVDSLFTSAAHVFGPGTLAVLLTGNGSDGTAGCVAVRAAGGCVIVQDADSAEFFSMPRKAIVAGAASRVLPLEEIASEVTRLVRQGREYMPAVAPPRHREPL